MKIPEQAGGSRLSRECALEEACLKSLLIHERRAESWVKSRSLESSISRLKYEYLPEPLFPVGQVKIMILPRVLGSPE